MSTTQVSPEKTRLYMCGACGNVATFVGYDAHGFPGDDCDCGEADCICEATLRQPFEVVSHDQNGRAERIRYDEFEGGGPDSEIGSYTKIECGVCGAAIWEEA